MFPIFNFRHTNRREVEAGVKSALEEHEREKRNKEAGLRLAEENARKENTIRDVPRVPITYDEVESVIAMVINEALTLSPSSILLKHAGRIVNTLEEMLYIMAKAERLQKIVDSPKFTRDGELMTFCGLPLDEAADAVFNYKNAITHIPRNCQTCRFKYGAGGEMSYLVGCHERRNDNSYCSNTEDHMCSWEWNKKAARNDRLEELRQRKAYFSSDAP